MNEIKLSATAIQDWEECRLRFLYRYMYGLQPEEQKDSRRIGETWHGMHEIIRMVPQTKCPKCMKRKEIRENCYLCDGTGVLPDDMMDAVVRYIDHVYSGPIPENKTAEEMQVERITLLYSFYGYRWFYARDRFETVASEVWFDNPIVDPEKRRKLAHCRIVGKVDHILRDTVTGLLYVGERKSTSQNLQDMKYWNRLAQDVQISTYLYQLRIAQRLGKLKEHGIAKNDPLIHGVWYDVWHKPDIKPKRLSQHDTKEFLETQVYCGEKFDVFITEYTDSLRVNINRVKAQVVEGKQGISIVETPEMYGERLLSDISERPDHYFAQREIARDDKQMMEYEANLARVLKAVRYFEKNDLWTPNCRSCRSPFYCDFVSLCDKRIKPGPNDVPEGFSKRGE